MMLGLWRPTALLLALVAYSIVLQLGAHIGFHQTAESAERGSQKPAADESLVESLKEQLLGCQKLFITYECCVLRRWHKLQTQGILSPYKADRGIKLIHNYISNRKQHFHLSGVVIPVS